MKRKRISVEQRFSGLHSVSVIAQAILIISLAIFPAFGGSTSVRVRGSANPYLAGMPFDATCCGDDFVPEESPSQVPVTGLTPGTPVTFAVTGSVNYGFLKLTTPPDGGTCFSGGSPSNNGIAALNAPVHALVGVFLDDRQPDSTPAPSALGFCGPGETSFASLSPGLKQVFFIGDGRTGNGSGVAQQFIIPSGASRLFLGTADGYSWYYNAGSFAVTVTTIGYTTPSPISNGNLISNGTLDSKCKWLDTRRRMPRLRI
jgi:hypothetical protein